MPRASSTCPWQSLRRREVLWKQCPTVPASGSSASREEWQVPLLPPDIHSLVARGSREDVRCDIWRQLNRHGAQPERIRRPPNNSQTDEAGERLESQLRVF